MKSNGLIVVHETNSAQHRICIMHSNGTNEVGEWVGLHQVANVGKYYAVCGESALPQCVFTCKEVAAQVLQ